MIRDPEEFFDLLELYYHLRNNTGLSGQHWEMKLKEDLFDYLDYPKGDQVVS